MHMRKSGLVYRGAGNSVWIVEMGYCAPTRDPDKLRFNAVLFCLRNKASSPSSCTAEQV